MNLSFTNPTSDFRRAALRMVMASIILGLLAACVIRPNVFEVSSDLGRTEGLVISGIIVSDYRLGVSTLEASFGDTTVPQHLAGPIGAFRRSLSLRVIVFDGNTDSMPLSKW